MGGQHRKVWGYSACPCQKCWRQFHFHRCPIPRLRRGTHWTGRGPSCQIFWTSQLWICPLPLSIPAPQGVSKEERRKGAKFFMENNFKLCWFVIFSLLPCLPASHDWLQCWFWALTQLLLSSAVCPSRYPAVFCLASSPASPDFPHGGAWWTLPRTSYVPGACSGSSACWFCRCRNQRDLRQQNIIYYTLLGSAYFTKL